MNWSNLAVWNMQIALLAGAATLLAAVFRLRPAPARLAYWQTLLALCVLLPWLQPWQRNTVVLPPAPAAAAVAAAAPAQPAAPRATPFPWSDAALLVLAAGMAVRGGWFGLGLLRLARYRRAARRLEPLPGPVMEACRRIGVYPRIALSDEISGPVTFGLRDPLVLLPADFCEFQPEVQSAVATHELLHIRRRDWLFTAIEEMVRVVFWFHPAVWWTLGQIQLAREQSVDRAVVKLLQTRERYVDALLAVSGARTQLDLAPAPLFLRRRHLTARVAAILREADMSKRKLSGTLAACAGGLLFTGWLVCARLPLEAAPQYVQDAPGVTVTGAGPLMHRSAVPYPAEARGKGVEGTLVLDVQVAADGSVTDATVLSGPQELRAGTLRSVLDWHFRPEAAGRQQVMVEFKAGATAPPAETSIDIMAAGTELAKPLPLDRIVIRGLSGAAEEDLRRRLNLREGQIMDNDAIRRVRQLVRTFDEHLAVHPAMVSRHMGTGTPLPPSVAVMIQPAAGATVNPGHAPAAGEAPRDLSAVPRKLTGIEIAGIPPEAAEELRRRLPAKEGDTLDSALSQRIQETVRAFDPRLGISMRSKAPGRRAGDGQALPESVEVSILIRPQPAAPPTSPLAGIPRRLARIDIQGLAPEAAAELRRLIPVKEGDIIDADGFRRVEDAVRAFDPHFSSRHISGGVPRRVGSDGKLIPPEILDITIHIRPADSAVPQASSQHIRVGRQVQASRLKHQSPPVYPPLAKQARIQGIVQLQAVIDAEGNVKSLTAIAGHPLLVPAAMQAVRDWRYEPTLLNGVPVEVVTEVDVPFSLER